MTTTPCGAIAPLASTAPATVTLDVELVWQQGDAFAMQTFFRFIRTFEGEVIDTGMHRQSSCAATVRVSVPHHWQWSVGCGPHVVMVHEPDVDPWFPNKRKGVSNAT